MNIRTWSNFSKRKNSTKQPTGGTTATVSLKESTSIESPTFILTGDDFNVNYIQAFGHYYYANDCKSIRNGIKEIPCTQDTLATYKSNIVGSSQYVERANSATLRNVGDPLNPPTNRLLHKFTNILNLTTTDSQGLNKIIDLDLNARIVNHYIMGITGSDGVQYWGLTAAQLGDVMAAIFGGTWIDNFASLFFNYKDCILSLKRVTYPPGGTSQQIYVGKEPLTLNGAPVNGTKITDLRLYRDSGLTQLSFPADDYLSSRDYPYYSPYTFGTLTLPFVGVVPLDVGTFAGDGKIGIEVFVDPFTADIIYKVRNSDSAVIGTYYGNCGASLPVTGQTYNSIGMGAGALQMIGGLVGGLTNPALAPMALAGAAQIFEGAKLHTQSNGTISSFIGGYTAVTITADIYTQEPISWDLDNMKATQGLIVNKQISLSSLSGYVKCRNASIDIPGFERDKTEIENYMNNGFYIE